MNAIIIIDKPAGWTSHDVVAKLRGALRIKRIGHGGTLDPMATGVLPIFIGRATRVSEYIENSDKEYIAGLKLGIVTDTQDATGNTLKVSDVNVDTEDLINVLPRFLGPQKQIPPMYSAIKMNGRKLYEFARRGVEVERPARDIHIDGIELLDKEHADIRLFSQSGFMADFILKIGCSKGTYIRTLCHDIGAALGCGGIMSSLVRTRAGVFAIKDAHLLDTVLSAIAAGSIDKLTLPIDAIFSAYPSVSLTEANSRKCMNGVQCYIEDKVNGRYRFYRPDGEFILFGEIKDGKIIAIKRFLGND